MQKIIFMGTPEFAAKILQYLIDNAGSHYQIVGVVTQPDKPIGRKRQMHPTPVKQIALNSKIPIFQPLKIRTDFEEIINQEVDLIITAAYGQIIPNEILNHPRLGCINVHGSLLPKFRGGAPIQRAIMTGEDITGVTLMYMNSKMDEGDMIAKEQFSIDLSDNQEIIFQKMLAASKKVLEKQLPLIFENKNERVAQDHSKATYAPNISVEDTIINCEKLTGKQIHDLVRGLNPKPYAKIICQYGNFKIMETTYIGNHEPNLEVGIHFLKSEKQIIIVGKDLRIVQVNILQPESKKPINAKDYLNGFKNA